VRQKKRKFKKKKHWEAGGLDVKAHSGGGKKGWVLGVADDDGQSR